MKKLHRLILSWGAILLLSQGAQADNLLDQLRSLENIKMPDAREILGQLVQAPQKEYLLFLGEVYIDESRRKAESRDAANWYKKMLKVAYPDQFVRTSFNLAQLIHPKIGMRYLGAQALLSDYQLRETNQVDGPVAAIVAEELRQNEDIRVKYILSQAKFLKGLRYRSDLEAELIDLLKALPGSDLSEDLKKAILRESLIRLVNISSESILDLLPFYGEQKKQIEKANRKSLETRKAGMCKGVFNQF